ncbi:hypothetical protein ABT072_47500 [Streptomyces sp. NPDC002589]|uniref:hypothetical protein n=1 Tax=Streptomyces sp. NPDC002589 TaxID=3154420 RepID=UPI00331AA4D6
MAVTGLRQHRLGLSRGCVPCLPEPSTMPHMGNDLVSKRWDAACVKAREMRPWHRDEQDALALIYYVIAAREAVEVEDISTHVVRYQIDDLFVLQQHLTELISSPRSGHTPGDAGEVMAERARTRLAEVGADQDEFSGPPSVESRIWRVWNSMQATHFEDREETLMSDEVGIELAPEHRFRDTGANMFEHAAAKLRIHLDRELLNASGHPSLGSDIEVTAGTHAGRTGSLSAVTWHADHEQHTIGPTPESFTVRFDDLYDTIDIPAGNVSALPQWDRAFVVVHAGEPFPTEWHASVLLADPDEKSLRQQVDALRNAWTESFSRLVVFVPHQADGSPMTTEHRAWATRAVSCADEIVARCLADAPTPLQEGLLADNEAAAVCARLVILVPGGEPSLPLKRWSEQHAVPMTASAADAAATVLQRTGRGQQRKGGERDVPLLVARTTGYYAWSTALRDAHRTLVSADIEWVHSGEGAGDKAPWWSMRARIRHADHRVTSELLVCHARMTSVVAYRRREKWTDCEIVLVPCDNSLSHHLTGLNAPKGTALRLPTVATDFSGDSDSRERRQQTLFHEWFGIDGIDRERLRSFGGRNDSSLLAAERGVAVLELTEDEISFLRSRGADASGGVPGGTAVVHRVADLYAEPICDWATLGAVSRAVMPASPPASGDFYTGRM